MSRGDVACAVPSSAQRKGTGIYPIPKKLLTPQGLKGHYQLGNKFEFCTAHGSLILRNAMICLARIGQKPTAKLHLNIAQHYAFFPFQSLVLVQHSGCDRYVSRAEHGAFRLESTVLSILK
jgi:hypothetical protein